MYLKENTDQSQNFHMRWPIPGLVVTIKICLSSIVQKAHLPAQSRSVPMWPLAPHSLWPLQGKFVLSLTVDNKWYITPKIMLQVILTQPSYNSIGDLLLSRTMKVISVVAMSSWLPTHLVDRVTQQPWQLLSQGGKLQWDLFDLEGALSVTKNSLGMLVSRDCDMVEGHATVLNQTGTWLSNHIGRG